MNETTEPAPSPLGVATPAPLLMQCTLWVPVFFVMVFGFQRLFAVRDYGTPPEPEDDGEPPDAPSDEPAPDEPAA